MADYTFWGAALRLIQALTVAAPTILVGLLMAAVFRRLMGPEAIRRTFGNNTWRALPQSWLMGMLTPVCSLGVIPVLREMRKAGVTSGALLAFAITAPIFNPVSLLYGLTLARPFVIITFAAASLAVVTLVGLLFEFLLPPIHQPEPAPPPIVPGIKRVLAVVVATCREAAGPSLLYMVIGLAGVVLLTMVLSPAVMQQAAEHTDPWAPLVMTSVAVPAYVSPLQAMSQLGSMFQHGNSIGAAFALLVLGAGVNLGLLAWVLRSEGFRRWGLWAGTMFLIVLALAYAFEKPLYPAAIDAAGHTHAFDIFCSPYGPKSAHPKTSVFWHMRHEIRGHEWAAMGMLGTLIAGGLVLGALDPRHRLERWLETSTREDWQLEHRPWYDRRLPGPVLGGAIFAGLVAFSIIGCFIYYPEASETIKELRIAHVEVVASGFRNDHVLGDQFIPQYHDWLHRLQVGVYLRTGALSEYKQLKAQVLLEKVELLEHALARGDAKEARELADGIVVGYRRLKQAYLAESVPGDNAARL